MRINELIAAKEPRKIAKSHFDNTYDLKNLYPDTSSFSLIRHHINEFIRKLEELGFKQTTLGSGIRGVVFQRPNDSYVIKIFSKDVSYRQFLDVCLRNQNNPYFPKVRGKPVLIAPATYVVRLEKLNSLVGEPLSSENDTVAKKAFDYLSKIQRPVDATTNNEIKKNLPELHDFFVNMEEEFGRNAPLDLHIGNIMLRDNRQIVITDPIVS